MCMKQMYVVLNSVGMAVKGTECEYKKDAKIIKDAMNKNPSLCKHGNEKGQFFTIGISVTHTK